MNEQLKKQNGKQTGSIEGGIKPELKVVSPPSNGAAPDSSFEGVVGDDSAPAVAGTMGHVLSNESNGGPLRLLQIREHLESLTDGWPKSAAGTLCYARKDEKTGRGQPEYIEDAAKLFAWVDRYAHVDWCKKRGCYTKEEFLRH